jgi:small nuclear ribonucleoprotein (snRNP)-like protein
MQTKLRQFATLVLVSSLLLSAVTVAAQDQKNNWSRVTALATGTRLSVKLRNGKTLNGTLNSASDSGLSLTVKNASQDVKRDEVASIHEIVKKKSAAKAALIGSGIGAGVGAATGAIGDAQNDAGFGEGIEDAATPALAVAGAAVGALVGYFVGRSGNKRVLIYEAK